MFNMNAKILASFALCVALGFSSAQASYSEKAFENSRSVKALGVEQQSSAGRWTLGKDLLELVAWSLKDTKDVNNFSCVSKEFLVAANKRPHIKFRSEKVHKVAEELEEKINITDDVFLKILESKPQIRSLDISFCTKISSAAIKKVVLKYPGLIYLDLGVWHDEGREQLSASDVLEMSTFCKNLEYLNLNVRREIHPDAIMGFVNSSLQLKRLVFSHCTQLTDKILVEAVSACPNLLSLDVMACHGLTQNALLAVAKKRPNLKELYVSYDDGLFASSETVINVSKVCSGLEVLSICHSCRDLDDEGLRDIVTNCNGLRALDLSQSKPQLTAQGIVSSVKLLPNLQCLWLFSCDQITDNLDAIKEIVSDNHKLSYLIFIWEGFSRETKDLLLQLRPGLNFSWAKGFYKDSHSNI